MSDNTAPDSVVAAELRYSATGLPPGMTIDPVTGNITGTPDITGFPLDSTGAVRFAPVVTVTGGSLEDLDAVTVNGQLAWPPETRGDGEQP